MKAEIIEEKTVDWFERMVESPWFDRVCLMVIGLSALYFGPIVIAAFVR